MHFCIIDTKLDQERRQPETTLTYSLEIPPPLPPRPGRGNIVYPNKPLVRPTVKMKALDWNRIILNRSGEAFDVYFDSCSDITIILLLRRKVQIKHRCICHLGDDSVRSTVCNTIWHSMLEPKIDNEEVER